MLLEQIGKDRIAAMKAKDATTKNILTTLKGEIERVHPKGATDEEVQAVIKASLKRLNETRGFLVDAGRDTAEQDHEIDVLEAYMPQLLGEMETEALVKVTIEQVGAESMKDMGKVMGAISKYKDVDKGLANKFVREALA